MLYDWLKPRVIKLGICAMLFLAMPAFAAPMNFPFPKLEGENLLGQKVTWPEALKGQVSFVAMGFSYESSKTVEAWSKQLAQVLASESGVRFYACPMYEGAASFAAPFINRGMKRATPKDKQAFTVTFRGDETAKARRMLKATKASDLWVFLVDQKGVVRWQSSGAPQPQALQEIERLVRQLP